MTGSSNFAGHAARQARIDALGYDYAAQSRETVDACNLCGHDVFTVIAHSDRYGYAASTTTCRRCGLSQMNPRLTREPYGEFYRSVYRPLVSAYHGRTIDSKSVKEDQRPYAAATARFLSPYLEPRRGGALLDVGGSTGVVAAHLAESFDLRATVIDPAPDELASAADSGLETIAGFVEDWDPGERRFDVVGMFQTIDHLLDVTCTLTKIREVMADDGLFVFDIVDFRAAYLRNESVVAATKIDHPFSLTETVTEAFLARIGFRIVRTSYSPDALHVMYVCARADADPNALPPAAWVREQFREMRTIDNVRLRGR